MEAGIHATNDFGWTVLHEAALLDKVHAVRMLLALETDGVRAVNVNAQDFDGTTAFMTASKHGQEGAMRALLEVGQSSLGETSGDAELIVGSIYDTTLLNTKKQHRSSSEVNVNEQNHNTNGPTALMQAAMRGRADIVRLLLEHNADVYACDEDGTTLCTWL